MVESNNCFLPVVFFDGLNDNYMGVIELLPSDQYASIRRRLSQIVGFPPANVKIFLVNAKSMKSSQPDVRRKVLVTCKSNLFLIATENDSILVVEWRMKKNKSKMKKAATNLVPQKQNSLTYYPTPYYPAPVPAYGFGSYFFYPYPVIPLQYSYVYSNAILDFSAMGYFQEDKILKCKECKEVQEEHKSSQEFHLCAEDDIIIEFRSSVGPIVRPVKPSN